jgi:hypothetical protein
VKLNSKGFYARFYLWFLSRDESLPDDFCTFFWGLIFRALFVLMVGGSFVGFLIVAAIWIVQVILAHKKPTLIFVFAGLVIAFVTWLSNYKPKRQFEFWEEAKAIVKAKSDSVKSRYCPHIDWK